MGWMKLAGTVLQKVPTIQKAVKSAAIAGPGVAAVALAVDLGYISADLSPASYAALAAVASWVLNTGKLLVTRYLGTK